jgi:hypothetical protein
LDRVDNLKTSLEVGQFGDLLDYSNRLSLLCRTFQEAANSVGLAECATLDELTQAASHFTAKLERLAFLDSLQATNEDGARALEQLRTLVTDRLDDITLGGLAAVEQLVDDGLKISLETIEPLFQKITSVFSLSIALAAQTRSFVRASLLSTAEAIVRDEEQQNEIATPDPTDAEPSESSVLRTAHSISLDGPKNTILPQVSDVHTLLANRFGDRAPRPLPGSAIFLSPTEPLISGPDTSTTDDAPTKSNRPSPAPPKIIQQAPQAAAAAESIEHVSAILPRDSTLDNIDSIVTETSQDTQISLHTDSILIDQRARTEPERKSASENSTAYIVKALALQLLPALPAAAFQLATTANDDQEDTSPLPVWLFRLLALAPLTTCGLVFANEQVRFDLQTAYLALNDERVDKSLLAPLLASCAIGPAVVAPDTTASTLLRILDLPGPINSLLSKLATLGDQLGGVDLFALAPHASVDLWNLKRKELQEKARLWKIDAEHRATSSLRFVPARSVLKSWLRSDGFLSPEMDRLASDSQSPPDLQRVSDLAKTTRADLNRHIEDADVTGHPNGNWIDGKAKRVLVDTAESAIALLQEWLVLERSRPTSFSPLRNTLTKMLPELDQDFAQTRQFIRDLTNASDASTTKAYLLLDTALHQLEQSLNGREQAKPSGLFVNLPSSIPEALGRDLLLLPLTLSPTWTPCEPPGEIAENINHLLDSSLPTIDELIESHVKRNDFLAAQRIVELCYQPGDTSSDILDRLDKRLQERRKPLLARTEIIKRRVELSFRDNLITEAEREAFQTDLAWLSTAFTSEIFRSSLARLSGIEAELTSRHEKERLRLQDMLDSMTSIAQACRERTQLAIQSGQFPVAGEFIRQLTLHGALSPSQPPDVDEFQNFFPDRLRFISDQFKTAINPAELVRRWVQEYEGAGSLGPLETSEKALNLSPILNAWFTRSGKPSLKEANVERLFKWLGFTDVVVTRDDALSTESRLQFRVQTNPSNHRDIIPLAAFGSERNGHYIVVCHANPNALQTEPSTSPAIHLLQAPLDEKRRRDISLLSRKKGNQFVVLDDFLLLHLLSVENRRLQAFFYCSLPFSGLQPYTGTASIVPPEIFYGREREIAEVVDPNGTCLIYGGRQLGKTALLLQVVNRYHKPDEGRAVYWIDLNNQLHGDAKALFSQIFSKLKALGAIPPPRKAFNDKAADDILSWLEADDRRRITFLLDEADDFLTMEQENGFENVGTLKSLMERSKKHFKVVFAGLHNVVRFSKLPNHPLAHFGSPVNIGPLMGSEWREALALIDQPLKALGHYLEEDAAISVLLQANYYPVLLQLWGRHILDYCSGRDAARVIAGPPHRVGRDVIDATYASRKDLREQLKEKFRFTLQLDERYMVIAYSLRHIADESDDGVPNGVEISRLFEMAMNVWPEGFRDMPHLDFSTYLDEMEGLGVLRCLDGERYAFQNPSVPLLMGSSDDVIAVLLQPRKLALRDPNQFRAFKDRMASPFSAIQLKELFGAVNGVSIVVGSDALGIQNVASFLEREESTIVRVVDHCADRPQFTKFCDDAQLPEETTTIFLADTTTPWNASWVEYAVNKGRRAHNTNKRRRWVFLVNSTEALRLGADLGDMETKGAVIIRLDRWGDAALTAWCNVNNITLNREQITDLSSLTGNQPWLLERFKETDRRHPTATAALKIFSEDLQRKAHAVEYAKALGLTSMNPEHALVLRRLAEYGDPCTTDELLDLTSAGSTNSMTPSEIQSVLQWGQRMSLVKLAGLNKWEAFPDTLFAFE